MLKEDDYRQHISEKFNTELQEIKNHLLEMGGKVEQQVAAAVDAIADRNSVDAERIIEGDQEVNQMEVAIDDECAGILARRQPAASDLRLVVTVIKINTDIERIGDEAVKIARQAIKLSEDGGSPTSFHHPPPSTSNRGSAPRRANTAAEAAPGLPVRPRTSRARSSRSRFCDATTSSRRPSQYACVSFILACTKLSRPRMSSYTL